MGYCILSRKEIADLLDKEKISEAYKNYIDYPFLPVGLLIDELEKRKKKAKLPQQLIELIEKMPEQVFHIPLTPDNLIKALKDKEFSEKYVSSKTNPFALMSEICLFDDSVSWVDKYELRESLQKIEWL